MKKEGQGKKPGKDEDLRMPEEDFDRIMGQVMAPEKQGGTLNNIRQDEKKHPGQLPTKGGRKYTDVRVTETPGSRPARLPKLPTK
jgi:hypothetical protein